MGWRSGVGPIRRERSAYNLAMSIQAPTWERSAKRQMGHVYANITIRNRGDEILVERGLALPNQVRTLTLERVMVDR